MRLTKVIQFDDKKHVLIVDAKLNKIGDQKPYFSLTGEIWEADASGKPKGRDCVMSGCIHDEILAHFPELADIEALHLSDIDGVPMYAEANGWYFLAGWLSTERKRYAEYHMGNGSQPKTRKECLEVFAKHCRLGLADAKKIAVDVLAWSKDPASCRQRWAQICEGMRPRWKQEADACIARHSLEVSK